jgi:hypothetical protein
MDYWSYFSIVETTYFPPIRDETNIGLLNLGSNIRDMLCALLLSYFFNNDRKPSKMPHISLLMLDKSNDNS